MPKKLFLIYLLFSFSYCAAQYSFKGQIAEQQFGKTVYLSIIEDYRKFDKISMEQILKKSTTDSLGYFNFSGDNLMDQNRIYRIHVDECSDLGTNSDHFFGSCEYSKSILFIAKNTDTIMFPTSFDNETLCEISSTNSSSSMFLDIDVLKEQMAYEFNEFRSNASKKLNSKKWFSSLQDYGANLNEPLAELYIYSFLSDRKNDTYSYYLDDINNTDYYTSLGNRLRSKYPEINLTTLYNNEIAIDQQIADRKDPSAKLWQWVLPFSLVISIGFNIFLILKSKKDKTKLQISPLTKLTEQEQNIVSQILKSKTNKEIANDMFISVSTVKTHINNVYKKLGVSTRDEIKQRFQ